MTSIIFLVVTLVATPQVVARVEPAPVATVQRAELADISAIAQADRSRVTGVPMIVAG